LAFECYISFLSLIFVISVNTVKVMIFINSGECGKAAQTPLLKAGTKTGTREGGLPEGRILRLQLYLIREGFREERLGGWPVAWSPIFGMS